MVDSKKDMLSVEAIEKTPFISDLKEGGLPVGFFLLHKISLQVSKKNIFFLRVIFSDKTGHLSGVYFDTKKNLDFIIEKFKEGDVVKATGILNKYNNNLQIRVLKLDEVSSNEVSYDRFSHRTEYNRRELFVAIQDKVASIASEELKQLCQFFLSDKEFVSSFCEAPASRFIHHPYIGGLLEHTYNVLYLIDAYSCIYKEADRDLLIAVAFLHDIGKVDEYEYLYSIHHSVEGKLKGHVILGYERLMKAFEFVYLDDNLRIKIEHMMLSHHGKREWGAIEEPHFLEAYLIHAADITDSSQFIYNHEKKNYRLRTSQVDKKGVHTFEYRHLLDREIYLG